MLLLLAPLFVSLPSNATILEGQDVTFSCTAASDQMIVWSLRRGETQEFLLVVSNHSYIGGIDMEEARLLGPLGSPLLLRRVGAGLNGISVVCLTLVNGVLAAQVRPFASLAVLCE